jgi:membrane protein
VLNLQLLRQETQVALDELEDILRRLRDANLVERTTRQGWVLARDADDIRLADVFRLFVFKPEASAPEGEDRALRELAQRISGHCEEALSGTLADLS